MPAVLVADDQIGRVGIVEMIDLEPVGEHRQVPFQKIDEDALARLEHRAKQLMLVRAVGMVDYRKHGCVSFSKETIQLNGFLPLHHSTIGGCRRKKFSAWRYPRS
jgi:hypothetical protein